MSIFTIEVDGVERIMYVQNLPHLYEKVANMLALMASGMRGEEGVVLLHNGDILASWE